ncbi:23S rRNA (uridine(2479)-2'-O)-methyltransferase [Paenibacillus sp. P1XP2]|nr:23S rRNA (uridine(2479)-2'-O)-methyltransferase [Paenibacillus sp. P1XP2]
MDILSTQNPRAKEWAQLLEKKHRDKQGKYLIEGIHLVQEALRSGADLECVAFDAERGIPSELASMADTGQTQWIGVSAAVIAKCSDTKTPQPVFAVVRKQKAAIGKLLAQKNSLVIVLDAVQDPGNVGTIIRTADAAGADGVIVGRGSADIYNPKTIRSTMGSMFHLRRGRGSDGIASAGETERRPDRQHEPAGDVDLLQIRFYRTFVAFDGQ